MDKSVLIAGRPAKNLAEPLDEVHLADRLLLGEFLDLLEDDQPALNWSSLGVSQIGRAHV